MIEEESPDCITESVDEGNIKFSFMNISERHPEKLWPEISQWVASYSCILRVGNIFVAQRSTVNVRGSSVETTNSSTEWVRPKAIASFCMSLSWILISKSSGNNLRQFILSHWKFIFIYFHSEIKWMTSIFNKWKKIYYICKETYI